MKRAVLAILFSLATCGYAADKAGEIVKYEGQVFLHRQDAVRGEPVRVPNAELFVGDSVRTKRAATAFVRFVDGSKAVVEEESILLVRDRKGVGVEGGRVLFDIKKQGEAQGLRISSKVALIGVKGTRFAVSSDGDRLAIYLKQGSLTVQAPGGAEFRRFKAKAQADFEGNLERLNQEHEKRVREMGREFDQKVEEMNREFDEFVKRSELLFVGMAKEFEMEAGTAVSIADGEARDTLIPKEVEERFSLLDSF